ncbi:uncharacterized protein C8R40DRAFT_1176078 [Lentinula edodes]|uniref:uncharacterized protein n=1 Tax=Lentinula edodes TaxID=5353 RepID=UPI001E8DC9A1|nr:uncharacterized protein C8R40DRAFT_1176078 [Lentinula edodes]KAH7869965.1 hypothetical protein C8R40DRAFT_1176078 [Lentinula edodes]
MSQDAAEQNIQMWNVKKLIQSLDSARGAFFTRLHPLQAHQREAVTICRRRFSFASGLRKTPTATIHWLPSTQLRDVIRHIFHALFLVSALRNHTQRHLSHPPFKDLYLSSFTINMRRSFEELQWRYNKREMRRISDTDGEGYLYAFVHLNVWKVGMSKDFIRRREEWDRDCPDSWRIWLPPIRVANRRRAESLAHLLLEMACIDRPRQRKHIEQFVFSENLPIVWSTIVEPILLWAAVA